MINGTSTKKQLTLPRKAYKMEKPKVSDFGKATNDA